MQCTNCNHIETGNSWRCSSCGEVMRGGVVLVTGISGSGVRDFLDEVIQIASSHGHSVVQHDIGQIMERDAEASHFQVSWERILDADVEALKLLRALSFRDLAHKVRLNPDNLHLVNLHLCFRWHPYLTKGFEPHILEPFKSHVRLVINVLDDLLTVRERLRKTSWGERKIRDLLYWRDEELFLADIYADMSGLDRSYVIARAEPPEMVEKLIWHPEFKKVYLSFPITHLLNDQRAHQEIFSFRDRIREFLVVFDPWTIRDYDATYSDTEMKLVRPEVGGVTEVRDYRFIDQADAIVVYYPKTVQSDGVIAEMRHAHKTGKPIFLYKPELKAEDSPFVVPSTHAKSDPDEFYELLKSELSPNAAE